MIFLLCYFSIALGMCIGTTIADHASGETRFRDALGFGIVCGILWPYIIVIYINWLNTYGKSTK